MSSRTCASIRIGGRIQRARTKSLLKAIREAAVSLEWGDAPFLPQLPEELVEAREGKLLRLCDEQANYGEFPELEATCRRLGLSYSRHSEGSIDWDAELVDWRPGMKKPLKRRGSNANRVDTYVSTEVVRKAIAQLRAGHIQKAIRALRDVRPDIAALPPFEIV